MLSLLIATIVTAAPLQSDTSYLYRVLLVRAAPGRLLELIEHYRGRVDAYAAAGERPILLRHRQGDQWDLMLVFPVESFAAHYEAARERRRAGAEPDALIAWREEVFMRGPQAETFRRGTDGGLFHIEMFLALPGKRAELFREREMENVFLARIDRPRNFIFTRAGGAAWDLMTIGVYRDLPHFASADTIANDRQDAAARAAGFEAANRIGTYLRSLLWQHHDTLAGRVF